MMAETSHGSVIKAAQSMAFLPVCNRLIPRSLCLITVLTAEHGHRPALYATHIVEGKGIGNDLGLPTPFFPQNLASDPREPNL
jgi:hypothetical protein